MLLNAAAVRGLVPNVPPLSPRFMGAPPPVSVKRKALFSPTGSRDFPHPVKFENLVPSICLYKHRFKDEDPPYFQLKHGKGIAQRPRPGGVDALGQPCAQARQ